MLVRSAKSQQLKSWAWNNIKCMHSCTWIYSMAHNANMKIQPALPTGVDFLLLIPEDLHIATLACSWIWEKSQHNKHKSWILGFGKAVEWWWDGGTVSGCMYVHHTAILTWISAEQVHWLHAQAQFEWSLEEQDRIHNEAQWIPAYFHTKSKMWKRLMVSTAKGSLKRHEVYCMHHIKCTHGMSFPWGSSKAHSSIMSPLIQYTAESGLKL